MDCKFISDFPLLLLSLLSILIEFTKAQEQPALPAFGLPIDGSGLVDKILELVREAIITHRLDPMIILDERLQLENNSISLRKGRVKGFSSIQRVGPVGATISFDGIKFRSALSMQEITVEQDVRISTTRRKYPKGHIKLGFENITIHQLYKLDFLGQSLTLEEFELSLADLSLELRGFGKMAKRGRNVLKTVVGKIKDPMLKVFNTAFKTLINAALEAIKTAIVTALRTAALALLG